MRALARFAAMTFAALIPTVASAQSDAVKALVGAWEISNADHDKTCAITLGVENAAGGFKLDFNRTACGADFPPLKDAGAWTTPRAAVDLSAKCCGGSTTAQDDWRNDRRVERSARRKRADLHTDAEPAAGRQG
jgi:hypothetical protein